MTGKQISNLRKRFGFSVLKLSEFLGVSISTVYRWESYGPKKIDADGLQGKLLLVMHEITPMQAKNVTLAYDKKGWMGGLQKLLDIAYKNI